MHAGEAETAVLLHLAPELVGDDWSGNDCGVPSRSYLTLLGVHGYSTTGIIGVLRRPRLKRVVFFWPLWSTPSTNL
jgi:hypothetical protein